MIKHQITSDLVTEIDTAHKTAQASVASARENMFSAIDDALYCANLVEKLKQLRKHDIAGTLAGVMSGHEVKGYLSLHDASKKRPTINDKRQLQFVGLLESMQTPEDEPERITPLPPSVISTSRKFIGNFTKAIKRRPASEMDTSERMQVKDVLKPVVEFYESL